jgi:hypothetical protein
MNFDKKYLLHTHRVLWYLTCRKILQHGATALYPFRRKACWRLLSPLKICCSRPGLNPKLWVQWQTR